jgi:YD repeat-containing protein
MPRADDACRLHVKTQPASEPICEADDDGGLVASLTNAIGFATSYTPDGLDRLSATTDPEKDL